MHRKDLLTDAIALTTGDRNAAYGPPYENLSDCAGLFTTYVIGKYRGQEIDEKKFALTAEDVAHFNVLQKMARSYRGDVPRPDTYIDMAAYSAIAGECAAEESKE